MPKRFSNISCYVFKSCFNFLFKNAFLTIFLIFLSYSAIFAEQLAIKNFSISEGLARNQVTIVYTDSYGFTWLGTAGGLSRFDGYGFSNYSTRHGLPNSLISGIAEAENGVFWVATHGGLCLIDFNQPLDENGILKIDVVQLGNVRNTTVYSIFQDSRKTLWAGTRDGLFKVTRTSGGEVRGERIALGEDLLPRREGIGNLIEDRKGNLWISNPDGLFRLDKNGLIARYKLSGSSYFDRLGNIALDEAGRLWIGGLDGLYVLKPPVRDEKLENITPPGGALKLPENDGEFAVFTEKHGLPDDRALEIFRASDGQMWIASRKGATLFSGGKFQTFTTRNGLVSDEILCFGEDKAGNVWLGTESTGAMRAARNGFTTYTSADGLIDNRIASVFEGRDGNLYVADADRNISRFDAAGKFVSVRPRFPAGITETGWSWQRPVLQDSRGEWWVATAQGVLRYPKVEKIEELAARAPTAVYDSSNGLAGDQVFRLFEDRQGNIWISNFSPPASGIARFDRLTGKIEKIEIPLQNRSETVSAYSYAEDGAGNVWLGLSSGKLARYRNGRAEMLEGIENLPTTTVYDMLKDARGNLWLATGSGAFYVENPAADEPVFTTLTVRDGLTTDDIIAVADDRRGRIYLATSLGVQRFDPETRRVELFTTADGIANSELRGAARDKNGNLWFATVRGLTKFEPEKYGEPDSPAPVLIRSVRAGGITVPVGELGRENISNIALAPNQNHLEIEVLGLSQHSGNILKYQFRLGENDWSEPTTQRQFSLVNLQPGEYRFEVRAVGSNGLPGKNAALVSFTVRAPFYRQWWFFAASVSFLCALAYLFYRNRVKRLLELEKVRRSIANDLHDDIGSSLSQISLMSEVLVLKQNDRTDEDRESLKTIAKTSREAVGAMSEMVWAINPRRDNLPDTIQRMRHFTSEILTSADIKFSFNAPAFGDETKIDVNTRRHLYLIYKEIINNAVRHASASEIVIDISKSDKMLTLTVKDDGRGFNVEEKRSGNGLINIRSRAGELGGKVEIVSAPGAGTSVTLRIPHRSGIFAKITT